VPRPLGTEFCDASIMPRERSKEPQCSYCGKLVEIGQSAVIIAPNRPVYRTRYRTDEDVPEGIVLHERCYEERDLTRAER
jgi:hypothetical protein